MHTQSSAPFTGIFLRKSHISWYSNPNQHPCSHATIQHPCSHATVQHPCSHATVHVTTSANHGCTSHRGILHKDCGQYAPHRPHTLHRGKKEPLLNDINAYVLIFKTFVLCCVNPLCWEAGGSACIEGGRGARRKEGSVQCRFAQDAMIDRARQLVGGEENDVSLQQSSSKGTNRPSLPVKALCLTKFHPRLPAFICSTFPQGAYVVGALSGYGVMASSASGELCAAHITGVASSSGFWLKTEQPASYPFKSLSPPSLSWSTLWLIMQ